MTIPIYPYIVRLNYNIFWNYCIVYDIKIIFAMWFGNKMEYCG